MTKGIYIVQISRSGYFVDKDLSFLRRWHESRARFESGKPLATDTTKDEPHKIAFIYDGSVSSNKPDKRGYVAWESCFVGTWKQAYENGGLGAEPGNWNPKKK